MTALQQIIKEAQAIRRKSPKMEWKKAVAQASAIYSSKNKGKKKVVKKKIAKKTAKKKLGALPIGFSGNIWGIRFKVINQYDIYGNVAAIVENIETGHRIITFDGHGSAKNLADIFGDYVARHGSGGSSAAPEVKALKSRLLKFATQMQKEVKEFNAGKKKTIKKSPISIPAPKIKTVTVKKVARKVAKKATKKHTHWKKVKTHERRVNGVKKSATTRHKDTKSHNVNIRVMSGVDNNIFDQLQKIKKGENFYNDVVFNLNKEYSYLKSQKGSQINAQKIANRKYYKKAKQILKELKEHTTQLKKHI